MTLTTEPPKYRKTQLVLPDEAIETLRALTNTDTDKRNLYIAELKRAGWTFESIGNAIDVSRERVRQLYKRSTDRTATDARSGYHVPTPPVMPTKEPKANRAPDPTPETLARLLELKDKAQRVSSNSSHYREEAEEYSYLLNKAHVEEGVPLAKLARLIGVTHSALRFRLVRYGYKPMSTKSTNTRPYTPIKEENRAKFQPEDS